MSFEPVSNARTRELFALSVVFTVLPLVAVAGRLASKRIKAIPLACDDWAIVLAMGSHCALFALIIVSIGHGVGHHVDQVVPTSMVDSVGRLLYIINLVYITTPFLIKSSILLLYNRLFYSSQSFHRALVAIFAFMVTWYLTLAVVGSFFLTDYSLGSDDGLRCTRFKYYSIAYATCNILTMLIIFVLPLPLLWRLQTSTHQKATLTMVLTFGSSGSAMSIARLVLVLPHIGHEDATWQISTLYIWTIVETGTGILCACLPLLRPLIPENRTDRLSRIPTNCTIEMQPHQAPQHATAHTCNDALDGLAHSPERVNSGYEFRKLRTSQAFSTEGTAEGATTLRGVDMAHVGDCGDSRLPWTTA